MIWVAPMTRDELQELVDFPSGERLDVEYKSWLDLKADLDRAGLAKELAALANHGGGVVVFGIDDKTWVPSASNGDAIAYITGNTVAGLIRRYLEPEFECEVRTLTSKANTQHPVITVPQHGATPICARASGPPDKNGRPQGITRGVYYIRKPGARSEPVETATEWAPLIRRCVIHDRSTMMSLFADLLEARNSGSTSPADALLEWQEAGKSAFSAAAKARGHTELIKWHIQYSYELLPSLAPLLSSDQLRTVLHEANSEVHDTVRTGWSMFYMFSRDVSSWLSDPNSGEGDEDFYQTNMLNDNDTFGFDFWRVSRTGKVTLIREYWEDRQGTERSPQAGTRIDIALLAKHVGELVRHARAFAERFDEVRRVAFRIQWTGLVGRTPVSGMHYGGGFRVGHSSGTDQRLTTGVFSVTELRDIPEVVAQLTAPIARTLGAETAFTKQSIATAMPQWLR